MIFELIMFYFAEFSWRPFSAVLGLVIFPHASISPVLRQWANQVGPLSYINLSLHIVIFVICVELDLFLVIIFSVFM